MKRNILLYVILVLAGIKLQAQTINIEFPYFAGQTYEFKIFQGEKPIIIQNDTIPTGGKVQVIIPKEYAGYKGMAQWYLTNSATGGGLDLILNNESFSVSCLDAIPNGKNIIYKNTKEHIFGKTNYQKQQKLFEKHDAMLATKRAYDDKSPLYILASKEYESLLKQYEAYSKALSESTLYAAKFRQIVNLTMGIGSIITLDENEKANNINHFITNELDFEALYTSNHWGGIINNWVQLQTKVIKDDAKIVANVKNILNRINRDNIYTDFVASLSLALTKSGKDSVLSALTPSIKNSKKLQHFDGILRIYQLDLSDKAPDLVISTHIGKIEDHKHNTTVLETANLKSKYSLLVFYKSDCGLCEYTIAGLKDNYTNLKSKEIRIITISADEDEQLYKTTADEFPWEDSYCDFEGQVGINFKNYAVLGTPTMYLLDSNGKIIEKLATIEQLLESSKIN